MILTLDVMEAVVGIPAKRQSKGTKRHTNPKLKKIGHAAEINRRGQGAGQSKAPSKQAKGIFRLVESSGRSSSTGTLSRQQGNQ